MLEPAKPGYVLDASVALKWVMRLDDEPFHEVADQVLRDYAADRIGLSIMPHTPFEIGHALTRAVRRGRIGEPAAHQAIELFSYWRIGVVEDILNIRHHALELAGQYGCSFYDATYLALAELFNEPLIHADDRLRNVLRGRFPLERWIEDYRSP
jgi:predicted nucleic acid-binding protein